MNKWNHLNRNHRLSTHFTYCECVCARGTANQYDIFNNAFLNMDKQKENK